MASAAQGADNPSIEIQEIEAKINKLRLARRDTLVQVVEICQLRISSGIERIDSLNDSLLALADAELAIASSPESKIERLKAIVEIAKSIEGQFRQQAEAGVVNNFELSQATAMSLRTEIELAEEQLRQLQAKE